MNVIYSTNAVLSPALKNNVWRGDISNSLFLSQTEKHRLHLLKNLKTAVGCQGMRHSRACHASRLIMLRSSPGAGLRSSENIIAGCAEAFESDFACHQDGVGPAEGK